MKFCHKGGYLSFLLLLNCKVFFKFSRMLLSSFLLWGRWHKKVSSSSHHWVCNTITITTFVVVWISSVQRWKREINRQNSLKDIHSLSLKIKFQTELAWLAQRRHHITQLTRITKVLPLSFKWIMNNELKGKNQSIISNIYFKPNYKVAFSALMVVVLGWVA